MVVQTFDERRAAHTKANETISRQNFPFILCIWWRTSSQLSLDTLNTHQIGISSQTYYEHFCGSLFRFAFRFTVHIMFIFRVMPKFECNSIRHRGCDRKRWSHNQQVTMREIANDSRFFHAAQCDKMGFIEYDQSENACHLFGPTFRQFHQN